MGALQVEIVTPQKSVYSGSADEVIVPGWEGQLGVLPQHDALLALLKCGVATVRNGSESLSWVVAHGFADIGGTHVTLLTDQCVAVPDVDKAEAKKHLEAVQAEMASDSIGEEALRQARSRAEWVQALVDA